MSPTVWIGLANADEHRLVERRGDEVLRARTHDDTAAEDRDVGLDALVTVAVEVGLGQRLVCCIREGGRWIELILLGEQLSVVRVGAVDRRAG